MDAELAEYYQHIQHVIQGPLWSFQRWQSIYHLNIIQPRYPNLNYTPDDWALYTVPSLGGCWLKPENLNPQFYTAKHKLKAQQQ